MKKTLITFTSNVSDLTYSGHPSMNENFIDCSPRVIPWPETRHHWKCPNTEPVKTLLHLKELMNGYQQPVTWVINDNEYTNLNGTLPFLKKFQEGGDSIMVTFEIVQRPSPVDRKNTEEVLRYAQRKCSEAGIRIDGVWSLKFWKSDIDALVRLTEEFDWAGNLAGACWMQGNHIDDSGWRGCPFGAYYPALNNIKGCQSPRENKKLVMMPWLTRDFATGIHLDRVEPYGLDPADPSRPSLGGFQSEEQSGEYLSEIVLQMMKNAELNFPNMIRIHEEVRCYFDEGHDKDKVINKIFSAIGLKEKNCLKVTIKDAFQAFREENPEGSNAYLYSGKILDWRYAEEDVMLYEDGSCQLHFKKCLGNYPYRIYDYKKRYEDRDGRYYQESIFPVLPITVKRCSEFIELLFDVEDDYNCDSPYALVIWKEPQFSHMEADFACKHLKTYDGNHLIIFNLEKGRHGLKLSV
jgi:hypothetical protein